MLAFAMLYPFFLAIMEKCNETELISLTCGSNAFSSVDVLCNELSSYNPHYTKDGDLFTKASEQFAKDVSTFRSSIANISVISFIVIWSKSLKDSFYGEKKIALMIEMLKAKVFVVETSKGFYALKEYPSHENVLASIRNKIEWSIEKREDAVLLYIEFSKWISKNTYGYILHAEDKDREIAANRKMPFEKYIKLISHLKIRERVLVKLFYFGKTPTREEVFSLKMEDLDFTTQCISFPNRKVHYPVHIFEDLMNIVGKKKTGFVFSSKSGERLSFSVPYRSLKQTLSKLNLDPNLTFNDLSEDS